MNVEKFKPQHLDEIDLQEHQQDWHAFADQAAYAQALAEHTAYTARDDSGEILICGGVVPIERDIGLAWCFLSKAARRRMLDVTRFASRVFDVSGKERVLATVVTSFAHGCRWLEVLGFKRLPDLLEGDGPDQFVYVRGT